MVSISGWNWKTRVCDCLAEAAVLTAEHTKETAEGGNVPNLHLFLPSLVQTQSSKSSAWTCRRAGGAFCPRLPLLAQRQWVPKGKSRSPWKRKEIFENRATHLPTCQVCAWLNESME